MKILGVIFVVIVTAAGVLWVFRNRSFIDHENRNEVHQSPKKNPIEVRDTAPIANKQKADATTLPKIISSATDTTITYDIEGESEEGSEVEAHYINQKISKAQWRFFGETGKLIIDYDFKPNGTINVVEKK